MKALVFDQFGGPEVLQYRDIADPKRQPGHAIVRLKAIGLNFADVYRRRGDYHLEGKPPFIAGYEGAGIIESIDAGPSDDAHFSPGDRVGFADCPFANAELVSVPFDRLIPLQEKIDFETAAASLLQGLTAQYLVRDSHQIRPDETMLVHAAAGGVGLLLTQIGKLLGARVFCLASSAAKRDAALKAGADATALYGDDWVSAVRQFSRDGVDVAYDSVGSTLPKSFEAVRKGGHVVFYGMAGGNPEPVDPRMLMDTSKTLTGGDLWNVLTSAGERRRRAAELFDWIGAGKLRINVSKRFPLSQGAQAHAFLESRAAIGKVLLIP